MKSTKKSLLLSAMSLLLCFAMLVGTTFAWFTDSVTSGVNKIVAGNLDVELWHTSKAVTTEQKIENNSENLLFRDVTLWEPGAYAYETFTVKNVGNLALKYKMNLNVVGKNDLNGHDLTEVIKVAVSDTVPADRDAAAALTGYTTLENWMLNKDNVSVAAGASDTFTVVLYWEPTENDNLYNANNENATHDALYIDLGVNLYATQVESESDSFGTDYDKAAALPVNSVAKGELDVTDASTANDAVVKSEQTITDEKGVMSVTYPQNVKLSNTTAVTGDTGGKKTDVAQKLEYKGETASDAMGSVTIGDDKAVASYELTLPVANDNTIPVTVTINYTKNLSGVKVYHNGALLPANGESATYDAASGVLTLTLKHASPIDIVYNRVSKLPANAKLVYTVDELKSAVEDTQWNYIALGKDIDLTNSGGSEQVAVKRDVTIDLNGFKLSGMIQSGSYLASDGATRLTLVDTAGGGQAYSKFKLNGGAMMQANAVWSLKQAVTINSGTYLSNLYAITCQVQGTDTEPGVIINGGTFKGSNDLIEGEDLSGPVGGCVNVVIGTVTINGGTFEAAEYGSAITAKSGDSHVDTVVTINGGTFSGACMFDMGSDHSSKTIINVYGGDFTVKDPDGSGLKETNFAYDNCTKAALVNNEMFQLNIMGGTFNMDPSAYVADGYHAVPNGSTWTVVKN